MRKEKGKRVGDVGFLLDWVCPLCYSVHRSARLLLVGLGPLSLAATWGRGGQRQGRMKGDRAALSLSLVGQQHQPESHRLLRSTEYHMVPITTTGSTSHLHLATL